MRRRLHELVLPADRWSVRVVSPVDIQNGLHPDNYRDTLIVHPGWAKAPERHEKLLYRLALEGFLPLGIDTRYAYSDRQKIRRGLVQPLIVGTDNPYFNISQRADNRWRYRRPTVLLDVCERLGVSARSYIGHSEGARVSVLASLAIPENTNHLIIVNGAGIGSSKGGLKRLLKFNMNRVKELSRNREELLDATVSAMGSTAYTLTHLRRTDAERREIQKADTWITCDGLQSLGVEVTVLHAMEDEMVSFDDAQESASLRPWIHFVPTEGSHSNIYQSVIHDQIIGALNGEYEKPG